MPAQKRRTAAAGFFLFMIFSFGILSGQVKVIFDTDMGSDCDDAGALAVLHVLADGGEAEILACIYSSGKAVYGPGCIDAINTYYGRPDIPIGAYFGGDVGDSRDPFARTIAQDTATYRHDIIDRSQVPDLVEVYRRTLASQEDGSVVLVTVGHLKGLYDLLLSSPDSISPLSGLELAAIKCVKWVCMGGRYQGGGWASEWNFTGNGAGPYTKTVVDGWPKQSVFTGGEIGEGIITGKRLAQTPEGNPVRKAYQLFLGNLNNGRPSWDLTAVLCAVRGLGDYWVSQNVGSIRVDDQGRNKWEPDPDKAQEYLLPKASVQRMQNVLDSLMTSSPASTGFLEENPGESGLVPGTPRLEPNYPNPFNRGTVIRYTLEAPSEVSLTVCNVLGETVKTLVTKHHERGEWSVPWAGDHDSGSEAVSGIYFYQIRADGFAATRKMLLLR